MSVRLTALAVVAMYVFAGLLGGYASAGEYDDQLVKARASLERVNKKIARLESCVANPAPCAVEDQAKAQKSFERAKAKLDKAMKLSSSNTASNDE